MLTFQNFYLETVTVIGQLASVRDTHELGEAVAMYGGGGGSMYACRSEVPIRQRAEGGGGVAGGGFAGGGRGEALRRRVRHILVASRRCCALKYVEVDEGVEEGGGEWDAKAGWKVGVVRPRSEERRVGKEV